MKYLSPTFVVIDREKLSKTILLHANSTGGCGFIGCPDVNYQAGSGCNYAYKTGSCELTLHNVLCILNAKKDVLARLLIIYLFIPMLFVL